MGASTVQGNQQVKHSRSLAEDVFSCHCGEHPRASRGFWSLPDVRIPLCRHFSLSLSVHHSPGMKLKTWGLRPVTSSSIFFASLFHDSMDRTMTVNNGVDAEEGEESTGTQELLVVCTLHHSFRRQQCSKINPSGKYILLPCHLHFHFLNSVLKSKYLILIKYGCAL